MAEISLVNSNIKEKGRLNKLREAMLNRPEICIERGHLMTESYKQTEDKPPLLRRAMALEKILGEMTIRIEEGELLVGAATGKRIAGPLLPEVQWQWYLDEMDTLSTRPTDSFQPLTEEEKSRTREMLSYWRGKSVFDKWISIVPQEYQKHKFVTWATGGANPWVGIHLAHCCPGYERVLNEGLNGIKKQINLILQKLDLANISDFNTSVFYKAIIITLDAVIAYAGRYALMAEKMAASENDQQRKAELEEIACICKWVPDNPARSFREALQSLWFAYVAAMLEGWGPGIAFGRMDQYLYPFYKKDLASGKITQEAALELIALFYIKLNELIMPFSSGPNADGTGQIPLSVVTLGGITKEGNNAVNELSYLFLEAEERIRLLEDIAVRIHTSTPESFLIKACEIAKLVRGKIKFVSDETISQQLLNDGKPIDFARDYAIAGCFIRTVPGRSHDPGGDFLNLPIMLEFALNNGKSRITGEQIGPQT
ncbi:MAG TPA: pyruvate formate lyase family protein, partial [Dehalococcoidia bacterium]|nr:pyruvate formate lyase family protein [Dehalococcoidia bacterium]